MLLLLPPMAGCGVGAEMKVPLDDPYMDWRFVFKWIVFYQKFDSSTVLE